MSRFWQDAMQVMEAATSAPGAGSASDLALIIERSGSLRIVMREGWSAEGLRSHYGSGAVYQVTHTPQGVCVEGRANGLSCTLHSRSPCPAASTFPSSTPLYTVIQPRLLEAAS
jgi:hypothetical protein